MALEITGLTGIKGIKGAYGEDLTSLYARVEPLLDKSGTAINFELYYYKDKAHFQAGGRPVKHGDSYKVDYTVSNAGYILYGLHQLLVNYLTTDSENGSAIYAPEQLTIVDVDIPA